MALLYGDNSGMSCKQCVRCALCSTTPRSFRMHNSQAEDGSHSLVVSVRDSAPTNPQTRLPNAPLSREYQHQQRHSNLTELTGAGTWATNDGEEGRHNRVIGARLRNEIAQDTHSREQYHANIVEQEQCAVVTTGVRSESNLKAKSPLKLVVQVSDDSTLGGADEFHDTDDDFSGLVVRVELSTLEACDLG